MQKSFTFIIVCLIVILQLTVNSNQHLFAGSLAGEKAEIDSIAPDTSGMGNQSAIDFAKKFSRGWNLGNTLEAIGGETAWGNPLTTQRLIDSVKAAGFNTIRIPVAWSRFTDTSTYTINPVWLNRVEEVVNYALNNSMYVVMNEHWDNGWIQPTYARETYVRNRLRIMWQQIALHFRDYDNHLLFAGTNEVMKEGDYGAPSVEYSTVQNGYNQLFVNTVRSTGGRNAYRYLVVQGFNTNIDYTVSFFDIPEDVADNRLMLEVHYYDPYNFTINSSSTLYVWGEDAPGSETWANESWADSQFNKMKVNFIDNGIPVLLGEYCASARLDLGEENNEIHAAYRIYWMQYITRSMLRHGLVPYYWDIGYLGNNASGLFDRNTGEKGYPEIIRAIMDTNNVTVPFKAVGIRPYDRQESVNLDLYPNPAHSVLNVDLYEHDGTLKIYDLKGTIIKRLSIERGSNSIFLGDLDAGMYFIQVTSRDNILTRKFLKK